MKHLLTLLSAFILSSGFAQVPFVSSVTGSSVGCSGTSVTFTASATNSPTIYHWSMYPLTIGVVYANNTTSVVTITFPYSPINYTVYCSAENSSGISPQSASHIINIFETPSVNFSGSTTFCQGSSTSLQASSTLFSASPTVSYNWSPGTGLNTTSGPNVVANPSTPTNYTVTAVKGACSNTAQVLVAPFESMSVTFSGANTFCQGSSTSLSASSTVFSASPTISYLWSPGTGLNTTIGQYVNANPSVSTTYTVTASLGGNCFNTGQITVGPNGFTPPVITSSATHSVVCDGDTVTLNASGANTYTWTNNVQNGIPFHVYNSNTYYVTGTDLNGCTGGSSVTVNMNPIPFFNIGITSMSTTIGQSTATVNLMGNAGATYSLNGVATPTNVVLTASTTTTFTFTSVNSLGCEYTELFNLYVNLSVGIEDISATTPQNYFKVYPNPSNGVFNIRSSNAEKVNIMNELGQVVMSFDLEPETQKQISGLSAGIYFLQTGKSRMKIAVIQ
jgi:hypothetical protein